MEHPLPQIDPMINHYIVLGKLTVAFSHLEGMLKFYISKILGLDALSSGIVTSPLSFKRTVDMLGSLFQAKASDVSMIGPFSSLLKSAISLENERNRLVHSLWYFDESSGQTLRTKSAIKYDDGFKITIESSDYAPINDLCKSIELLTGDIALQMNKFKARAV